MTPRSEGDGRPELNDSQVRRLLAGLLIAVSGGMTLSTYAFIIYHPVSSSESIAKLIFYTLALVCILYVVMKGFIDQKARPFPRPEIVRIYFIASLISYSFALLTYANAQLDKSQASEYELVVSDKFMNRDENHTSQYVRFDCPVGASYCFLLEESDTMLVKHHEFPKVVVGETIVLFRVKKGFIGLPWIQSKELRFQTSTDQSEKVEAMAWQGETIKNDIVEFQEERWPNGQHTELPQAQSSNQAD